MSLQQMLIAGGKIGPTLMAALTTASLTTNLKLCLDAGDSVSYTSGQSWLDRSGGGYDFFLGADGSATATDPTFVGQAGGRESHWTFDGGDYFTYDTTNETWMQNIHKNNAIFSIVTFFYQNGTADLTPIGDYGASSTTGFAYYFGKSPQFYVANATAIALGAIATNVSLTAWHMAGLSINEATGVGGGFFYSDGGYSQVAGADTFNSTYSSPAVGNATSTLQIGAIGGNAGIADAGGKMACIAVWEGTALSKANMDTIFAAMRGRFGI